MSESTYLYKNDIWEHTWGLFNLINLVRNSFLVMSESNNFFKNNVWKHTCSVFMVRNLLKTHSLWHLSLLFFQRSRVCGNSATNMSSIADLLGVVLAMHILKIISLHDSYLKILYHKIFQQTSHVDSCVKLKIFCCFSSLFRLLLLLKLILLQTCIMPKCKDPGIFFGGWGGASNYTKMFLNRGV